jgi:hypothetical protein
MYVKENCQAIVWLKTVGWRASFRYNASGLIIIRKVYNFGVYYVKGL